MRAEADPIDLTQRRAATGAAARQAQSDSVQQTDGTPFVPATLPPHWDQPQASPPLQAAPVTVGACRLRRDDRPGLRSAWGDQLAPLIARLMHASRQGPALVHVTGAEAADDASAVARLIAATAAGLPWCRTLMLDAHPPGARRDGDPERLWPDLATALDGGGPIQVLEAQAGRARLHVAAVRPDQAWSRHAELASLRQRLHAAYTLIVIDCPPFLDLPFFPPLAAGPAEAILVVRARTTRISTAQRARAQIVSAGGALLGVVMTAPERGSTTAATRR